MTFLADVNKTPQVSWSLGIMLLHQTPRLLKPGICASGLLEVVNFIKYDMLGSWKLSLDESLTANGIAQPLNFPGELTKNK